MCKLRVNRASGYQLEDPDQLELFSRTIAQLRVSKRILMKI